MKAKNNKKRLKMKNRNPAIIFIIIIYTVTACDSCLSNEDEKIIQSHPVVISEVAPDYYLKLFRPATINKLKLTSSYENIGRDTVCNFLYDEKYYVQLYRLSRSYDFSVKSSLKEVSGEIRMEVGTLFYTNSESRLDIMSRMVASKTNKLSSIYVSFGGSKYDINAKNDSLVDYSLKCKHLSIKYNVNGPQEIFAEVANNTEDPIPLEILVFKNRKNLYLAFFSPFKISGSLPGRINILIAN
jgi:hypothetical protein